MAEGKGCVPERRIGGYKEPWPMNVHRISYIRAFVFTEMADEACPLTSIFLAINISLGVETTMMS
jgi:hypothetical protein